MSSFTAFVPQLAPARVTLKALALAAIGAFALACMQPAHATPCPTNYGNQGNQGDYGNQGNQGNYGNQGDQGNYGNQGNQGDYGNQGNQGDYGNQGNQGNYGNQGNQGNYGNQGNQGDYGNQGNNCGHQTVPEPGTLALFAAGLLGCALFAARRRARQR